MIHLDSFQAKVTFGVSAVDEAVKALAFCVYPPWQFMARPDEIAAVEFAQER